MINMIKKLVLLIIFTVPNAVLADEKLRYTFSSVDDDKSLLAEAAGAIGSLFGSHSNYEFHLVLKKVTLNIGGEDAEFYNLESELIDKLTKSKVPEAETKGGLYKIKTGALVKTKIISNVKGKTLTNYQADVVKGIDDWTGKPINEVITKNYVENGIKSDENGSFNQRREELLSESVPLDTYGFLLHLYKFNPGYSIGDQNEFYYIDKGFVKTVQLIRREDEKEGGCERYDVVHKSKNTVLGFCLSTDDKKPLWVSFGTRRMELVVED